MIGRYDMLLIKPAVLLLPSYHMVRTDTDCINSDAFWGSAKWEIDQFMNIPGILNPSDNLTNTNNEKPHGD